MSEDWKTRITKVRPAAPAATASAPACLVQIYPSGAGMGRRHELRTATTVIGRGHDCDIHIDRDSVSRRHARIVLHGKLYAVEDLGSTNGTYVADRAVSRQDLEDGDIIKIGNSIFKFLSGGNIEAEYYEAIYRMTIIDALTEAHNKRSFLEFVEREMVRCGRYRRALSLVLFDIDHFKQINDQRGHLTGDHVLRELGRRVRTRVRRDELFARYGGEEFAVVLPEAELENALRFAEEIRGLVADEDFEFEGARFPVRISLGVTTTHEAIEVDDFIRAADQNLYRAKRAGRDRVVG